MTPTSLLVAAAALSLALAAHASSIHVIPAGDGAALRLASRLVEARPGDTIQLEAGIYAMDRELSIACPNLTLRGAGPDKTILSFKGQEAGTDGIVATGNAFTIEDLAVQDTVGNALKVLGADGVAIRRVRAEWTDGPKTTNGPYGIYPVQCRNVLIEECVSIGASDAGIYVGQSKDVVLRRCRAEQNVAGIEIENTSRADVYENTSVDNTGGLLIFDLPNLQVPRGGDVRVFKNTVQRNNRANFAAEGTLVAGVPSGTGVMVMATDRVEVFDNDIADNRTVNAAVVSFHITERKFTDPKYDAYPEGVYLHGNRFKGGGDQPAGKLGLALTLALGRPFPDILYDGIVDAKKLVRGKLPEKLSLALGDNGKATFANVHLADFSPTALLTGAYRPERDAKPYTRRGHSPPEVALGAFAAPPRNAAAPMEVYRTAPKLLSEWGLFQGNGATQRPAAGVLPYDLNTPLFSDHSSKHRFIRLPARKSITYKAAGVFDFPVGTAIAKTFAFQRDARDVSKGEQLVETRIEVKHDTGWYGFSYLWNAEQSDAALSLAGSAVSVERVHADGVKRAQRYLVPSVNQCLTCHAQNGRFVPLGPTARNLNRPAVDDPVNQLAGWVKAGALRRAPAEKSWPKMVRFDEPASGTVNDRSRAWLAVNCAHCHNPLGSARTSGLDLRLEQLEPARFGIFKTPVATGRASGGRHYDIVPGHPEQSILVHRLESDEPGVRMPSLTRQLPYPEAVALITQWIREMPPAQ